MRIENAKITNTELTMKDHGVLSFWLMLEGHGWGVGFGGYCIAHGFQGADEFIAEKGDGLVAIMKVMDTVGVDTWEDLKGKYIRCQVNGLGDPVTCIGNLIDDKWFDIKSFFQSRKGLNNG